MEAIALWMVGGWMYWDVYHTPLDLADRKDKIVDGVKAAAWPVVFPAEFLWDVVRSARG